MAMLSDQAIEEFRRLYKQRFGKELSKQEALERGTKLIEFVKVICTPTTIIDKKPNQRYNLKSKDV